jgi:hypothetical protein
VKREGGHLLARILKGKKPGDVPGCKRSIRINPQLKTARTLGIDGPMAFSAAADGCLTVDDAGSRATLGGSYLLSIARTTALTH